MQPGGARPFFHRLQRSPIAQFALLLVAALLCYAPALNGPFLWDDTWLATLNPFIKSPLFAGEVFRQYLFPDSFSAYYRPVQNISYMLDYWAWGRDPFGFHLTNVLLHAGAAMALCQVLKRIFAGSGLLPLAISLLWVVHPVHNAAVAYISGRADSLASLLALAAWLFYEKTRQGGRVGWAFPAVFCLFLALGSKEIAFTWAALFAVHEFFLRHNTRRWNLGILGALLAVFGVYLWLRFSLAPRGLQEVESEPLETRLLLVLRAMGDYVWLILFPDNLHMERVLYVRNAYQNQATWQANLRLEYLSTLGALALAGAAYACTRDWPGQRLRVFGALWFLIGFLPVSNLFPLNAQCAEHWIYMPSIGFLVFLAGCRRALDIPKRFEIFAVVCIVGAFTVRTAVRSADWADPERFFEKTVASGGGTPRVRVNLAGVYERSGRLADAESILRRVVELLPDYATARINLGMLLLKQGKKNEAEALLAFDKATADHNASKYPYTWSAALRLACEHAQRNERPTALAIVNEALSRHPQVWDLVKMRADLLDPSAALPLVADYVKDHWWHYGARMELARLQFLNRESAQALRNWRRAAWLDIRQSEPYQLIARLHFQENRFEEAQRAQLKALGRDSNQPSQFLFLASIYERLQRPDLSAKAIERAEELRRGVLPLPP